MLANLCDFALTDSNESPPWFELETGGTLDVIARDKSGGLFALCTMPGLSGQPVLYVSSEGQAGVVGSDLAEALGLIVALPRWGTYLHFSGGGRLEEMKKAAPYIERELREDHPHVERKRKQILSVLALVPPPSAVETLHRVVSERSIGSVVSREDRSQHDSLFNTFTVEDNPMWSGPDS